MNDTIMIIIIQNFVWIYDFIFPGQIPTSRICGLMEFFWIVRVIARLLSKVSVQLWILTSSLQRFHFSTSVSIFIIYYRCFSIYSEFTFWQTTVRWNYRMLKMHLIHLTYRKPSSLTTLYSLWYSCFSLRSCEWLEAAARCSFLCWWESTIGHNADPGKEQSSKFK